MIFGEPLPLKEKEEKAMEEYRKTAEKSGKDIPEGYDDAFRLALRLVQGHKFVIQTAVDQTFVHRDWAKEHLPM